MPREIEDPNALVAEQQQRKRRKIGEKREEENAETDTSVSTNGQERNSTTLPEQEKANSQPSDSANVDTQSEKEISSQIRKEEDTQTKETAELQKGEKVSSQSPTSTVSPVGGFSDEQLRQLAEMVTSVVATTQTPKKEKVKKVDLHELLLQAIASSEVSDDLKSQFAHIAKAQKGKINQGVFAPEALFTLYRNASLQLSLTGKKVSAGDLMALGLTAYIPQLMKDFEEAIRIIREMEQKNV